MDEAIHREWLETDGRGGYASGTVAGIRTRRYHALLIAATTPPSGRVVLVNGFDAWLQLSGGGRHALTSQRYAPGITEPDGWCRIVRFEAKPWPRWVYRAGGVEIEQEVCLAREPGVVIVCWRLLQPCAGATLEVRPFLSGRDHHAMHHENPAFRFDATVAGGRVSWAPYRGLPRIAALSNGHYTHAPDWYRHFQYDEERARGLDDTEDLAAPGVFRWDLSGTEAVWMLAAESAEPAEPTDGTEAPAPGGVAPSASGRVAQSAPCGAALRVWADAASSVPADAALLAARWRRAERRRRSGARLLRSADAYVVRRGAGKSIIAGYPWFTDWGRDTFIAMRGLCLATGRLDDACAILVRWSGAVSQGMLPNRFADSGEQAEYNSVDAALWFIVAVHEFRVAAARRHWVIERDVEQGLRDASGAILDGYLAGTRHGIRCDGDGLLAAGEPGVQLTWMDAIAGGRVVTPRIGKPVEVQALWLNALRIGADGVPRRAAALEQGLEAFEPRFWDEAAGRLYDVVDADHVAGKVDGSMRPNQIFAVGGLPHALLHGERARRVVEAVEAQLLTPLGLRSLASDDAAYRGRYEGSPEQRDVAYHQGTVWPWLMGPFVEAWVRVRGDTAAARREARTRFLEPLLQQLEAAGIGHLCEIADGDPPHTPRGCPFQAWSLGEVLRLDRVALAP
jgi:glycogen debranching enzyme